MWSSVRLNIRRWCCRIALLLAIDTDVERNIYYMKFFAAILLAMLAGAPLFAADLPTKPIKIIVPYPPGGGTAVLGGDQS